MIGVNRAAGFSVALGMKAIRFSSRLATLTVAGLIIGGTASMSASTHADVAVTHEDHADNGELTAEQQVEIYQATARFNDVDVAVAAGYAPAPIVECVDVEGYGGMGLHYVNLALAADGVIDPAIPEVLVYVPTADGGLELGAVEYANIDADQDLATDDDRPGAVRTRVRRAHGRHEPGACRRADAGAGALRPTRVAVPGEPGRHARGLQPRRQLPA